MIPHRCPVTEPNEFVHAQEVLRHLPRLLPYFLGVHLERYLFGGHYGGDGEVWG